jgi:hypothetical protein
MVYMMSNTPTTENTMSKSANIQKFAVTKKASRAKRTICGGAAAMKYGKKVGNRSARRNVRAAMRRGDFDFVTVGSAGLITERWIS